ncbi:MAG TPA: hypothetical protein VMZ06_08760 [Candidatus Bathyarchaeia archaeon]|nr:hypothetical protein [Candidatus Bathyarchaeia archaeon]
MATRKECEGAGPVIKRVVMDQETSQRMLRMSRLNRNIEGRLTGLIMALFEESERATDEMWDEVARLVGYESLADVHRDGCSLKVDWLATTVQLRGRKDIPELGTSTNAPPTPV